MLKRLSAIVTIALGLCGYVFGATDTKTHSKSLDIARLREDFKDFRHKVDGFSTHEFSYTITNSEVAGVFAASDYSWQYNLLGRDRAGSSNLFYLMVLNADITKSGNNVSFTVNPTNVPPNGTYKGQLIGYTTSVTNFSRNMGKGTWTVTDSLYDEDNTGSYPYPTFSVTGLTLVAGSAWAATNATLYHPTNLSAFTDDVGYSPTSHTHAAGSGDITSVDVSGGYLSGGAATGAATVTLTAAAITNAIKSIHANWDTDSTDDAQDLQGVTAQGATTDQALTISNRLTLSGATGDLHIGDDIVRESGGFVFFDQGADVINAGGGVAALDLGNATLKDASGDDVFDANEATVRTGGGADVIDLDDFEYFAGDGSVWFRNLGVNSWHFGITNGAAKGVSWLANTNNELKMWDAANSVTPWAYYGAGNVITQGATVMSGTHNLGGNSISNGNVDAGVTGGAAGTTNAFTSSGLVDISGLLGGGGGGSSLTVEDEGVNLSSAVTNIDFVGAGVTVTEPVADTLTVTVPGDVPVYWGADMSTALNNMNDTTTYTVTFDTIRNTNGCNFNTSTYAATNLPNGQYWVRVILQPRQLDALWSFQTGAEGLGGFWLEDTGNIRYDAVDVSDATSKTTEFTGIYTVTNGNGSVRARARSFDPEDDVDLFTSTPNFVGCRIGRWN